MKSIAVSLMAVAALGGIAGCASSAATVDSGAPAAVVEVADSTIIDVRTPGEYASGHLAGATNINLESADFTSQIATLDKNGSYLVYCRSGNRSAQAVSAMKAAGFTNVTDIGGVAEAVESTGVQVVS